LVEKAAFPLRFISPKVTGRCWQTARAFAADAPLLRLSGPARSAAFHGPLPSGDGRCCTFCKKNQRGYENAHHLSTQIQDKQKPVLGQAGGKNNYQFLKLI
jgi:hypothetical protein